MARGADLAGNYIGRPAPRPGREEDLSPAERKRYEKTKEEYPLTLRPDGTYNYKTLTEGVWTVEAEAVVLTPSTFGGKTLAEQRAECERLEKEFRFAFVYDVMRLYIEGDALITPKDGVIVTLFRKA